MAAKTLNEALFNAKISHKIKEVLCTGPYHELVERIESAELTLIATLKNELRDYFAHRVMIIGDKASALDLFKDAFGDVPAIKKNPGEVFKDIFQDFSPLGKK